MNMKGLAATLLASTLGAAPAAAQRENPMHQELASILKPIFTLDHPFVRSHLFRSRESLGQYAQNMSFASAFGASCYDIAVIPGGQPAQMVSSTGEITVELGDPESHSGLNCLQSHAILTGETQIGSGYDYRNFAVRDHVFTNKWRLVREPVPYKVMQKNYKYESVARRVAGFEAFAGSSFEPRELEDQHGKRHHVLVYKPNLRPGREALETARIDDAVVRVHDVQQAFVRVQRELTEPARAAAADARARMAAQRAASRAETLFPHGIVNP